MSHASGLPPTVSLRAMRIGLDSTGSSSSSSAATKSASPRRYSKVSLRRVRSSARSMRRPGLSRQVSRSRVAIVSASSSVVSNTCASGQNRTTVPLRLARPTTVRAWVRLPREKAMAWRLPSRTTSTSVLADSALTTDTPTPCRPPDTA